MAAFSPAADRNKWPIGKVLKAVLPERGRVLEIGSGTAQHVLHFSTLLPNLVWQPSEHPEAYPSLADNLSAAASEDSLRGNIQPPLVLDVLEPEWPAGPFDAAYSANTAHIMPWEAVVAMLAGVSQCLKPGSPFILYGPFKVGGQHTADSNAAFDRALREQVPHRGIRDREALAEAAAARGLKYSEAHEMPANNQLLILKKTR